MDNATYATLGRQTGLMAQMRVVANNIANANTTGFRGEGVVFSEVVRGTGGASLSMATARVHVTDQGQGALARTGGTFDLAVEGEGFFMVRTPGGDRLTRAGHFGPDAEGMLVTTEGFPVLDAGGAPMVVPSGTGVGVAADGTVSAEGVPVGQVGLFVPRDPLALRREDGTRFEAAGGTDPAPGARVLQGFLEESNVDPVAEVARMIEVSRAYEMGQSLLEREDQRVRSVVQALTVR